MNVVGHALRTPMATVRGQVEVLARTTDPAERDRLIEQLLHSSRKLERLLDDVLVSAEVDTRLPVGAPMAVALAEAVESVWQGLETDGRQLAVGGDRSLAVRVGADALPWMLRHLLENAIRYGQGTVHADAEPTDDRVRLSVWTDKSDPIPDEDLQHAFELFYRGEAAVIASATRMGVGLPVTRRLAELSGGSVRLERDGQGRIRAELELPRA